MFQSTYGVVLNRNPSRNRQGAKIAKEGMELETLFKFDSGADISSYLGALSVRAVSLTFVPGMPVFLTPCLIELTPDTSTPHEPVPRETVPVSALASHIGT